MPQRADKAASPGNRRKPAALHSPKHINNVNLEAAAATTACKLGPVKVENRVGCSLLCALISEVFLSLGILKQQMASHHKASISSYPRDTSLHNSLLRSRAFDGILHFFVSSLSCYGGLGRSALIAACLLLQLSLAMTPNKAIEILREHRGGGAIQTVKQYNFLHEFRERYSSYQESRGAASERSVSR